MDFIDNETADIYKEQAKIPKAVITVSSAKDEVNLDTNAGRKTGIAAHAKKPRLSAAILNILSHRSYRVFFKKNPTMQLVW